VKADKLTIVETITSTKLAGELNKRLGAKKEQAGLPISVFIQVNTSGEENKNGLEPKDAVMAAEFIQQSCPNLKLTGLMTIGDLGNSEAASTTVEVKHLKIFGSVNISTLLQKISRHRNIYIQSKALSSFLRSRCSMFSAFEKVLN